MVKKTRCGAVFGAVLAMAAGVGPAKAVVTLDQSNLGGAGAGGAAIFADVFGFQQAAQIFTVGLAGDLDRVEIELQGVRGSPSGPLFLDIQATAAGTPNGTVLASASLGPASVPGFAMSVFDLSAANLGVNVGDVLAIVLRANVPLGNDYLGNFTQDTYAAGHALVNDNFGGWGTGIFGNADMHFQTFVDVALVAAPEPASLALLGLGLAGLGLTRRRRS